MPITRRAFLAGAAAAASVRAMLSARGLAGQDPAPLTPPATPRHNLVTGQNPLGLNTDRDGVIYIPKDYKPSVPMPLVVALHGAGGSGAAAGFAFNLADEFGYIVLAPDSRDWTWDSVLQRPGPDTEFIVAAFRSTLERCAVDRRRVAMAGLSDGASHVLSLGIANGDTFGHLLAFSPGLMEPLAARGKPRIFIHGTKDNTMPIDDTSRAFVPRLKALGYDVTYREFDGGHMVPPDIAHDAFKWFMDGSAAKG